MSTRGRNEFATHAGFPAAARTLIALALVIVIVLLASGGGQPA